MTTLVTPKGFGINVGGDDVGTASQITWRGSLAFMGNWKIFRRFLGIQTQRIHLGIETSLMVLGTCCHLCHIHYRPPH